jgi:hypothetical protein
LLRFSFFKSYSALQTLSASTGLNLLTRSFVFFFSTLVSLHDEQ